MSVVSKHRPHILISWIAVITLSLMPFFAGIYEIKLLTRMMSIAILAMGLNLLVGYAGLPSLGHAAFFGLAGYSSWLLTAETTQPSLWLLPIVLAWVGIAAMIAGLIVLRTRGVYFLMTSLALSQMAYYLVHDSKTMGGSDGVFLTAPIVAIGDRIWLDLADPVTLYIVALACMITTYAGLSWLIGSSFGLSLRANRENERRMHALGYNPWMIYGTAFLISAILAGLAGFLASHIDGYITPAMMDWRQSAEFLIIVIIGGTRTIHGPAWGAFLFLALEEILRDPDWVGSLANYWQLPLGLIMIMIGLQVHRKLGRLKAASLWRKPLP